MTQIRPNIFKYLDFRDFLQDWFAWRREDEPDFSMRTFLGKVSHGLSSSGILSAILKGKRNLSPALKLKVLRALSLKDKEAQYFNLLVDFNQAKGMEEKNQLFQQLSRFRESKAQLVSEEQYGFYSKWYYLVVWCYFGMNQREKNPHAIAKHIQPSITQAQVEEAIQKLLGWGLIKKTANGYATTESHISTEAEVRDMVAHHHHKEFIAMADRMLDETPPSRRQYQTLVFSVSPSTFETVKERMVAFQEELRELLSRDKAEDTICALTMQLFPHTREEAGRK
jgi:uncharacterized protein (TIGR02147 family)